MDDNECLTWSQRVMLTAMITLLVGCAAVIGVGAFLAHRHAVPAPPVPSTTAVVRLPAQA
jgi:hypothetical protein